jgi:membrane-associated phospholipid phosphatase
MDPLTSTDDPPLTGFTLGGRLKGWLADPIAQCLVFILVVSAVFLVLPQLDIWFTSLFASSSGGFPVGTLAFFKFLRGLNQSLTAIVPTVLTVVLIAKVVRPDRPSLVPPAKTLFLLSTLALGPGIVVNLIFKGHWGRPRPNDVTLFGPGEFPYVPPWVITNYCPGNCSFVSGEASSAIWLLGLAVLVPKEWRKTALKVLFAFAVAASLNRIAFGGHYLSDVLLAWGLTLLIMAIAYRYILERPLPWFENTRMEADLTRLGIWVRRRLGFPTLVNEPHLEASALARPEPGAEREAPPER